MESSPEVSPIQSITLSDSDDSDSEVSHERGSSGPRAESGPSPSKLNLVNQFRQAKPLEPRPNGGINRAFSSPNNPFKAPVPASASSSTKSFKSFASTPEAFSTVSAKQRAFQNMEAERAKLGVVGIAVPKAGKILPPNENDLIAKAARLAIKAPEEDELEVLPVGAEVFISEGDANKALRELIEESCDFTNISMEEASLVGMGGVTLMPHQIQGLYWLKDRETGKKHGGILADVILFLF